MAVAYVQRTEGADSNGAAGGATTSAFSSNTTSGNALIISIGVQTEGNTISSVTDNKSNSFSEVYTYDDADAGMSISVWAAHNITGGASHTVTYSLTTGGSRNSCIVHEVSGLPTSGGSFDVSSENVATGSATINSGTTATLRDSDSYVVGIGWQTTANTLTVGSGYSNFEESTDTSGKHYMQNKVVASTTGVDSEMGNFQTNVYGYQAVLVFSATPLLGANDERGGHIYVANPDDDERSSGVYGGDGRYVEHFTSTTKKDEANTTASWTTDGTAEMDPTFGG